MPRWPKHVYQDFTKPQEFAQVEVKKFLVFLDPKTILESHYIPDTADECEK